MKVDVVYTGAAGVVTDLGPLPPGAPFERYGVWTWDRAHQKHQVVLTTNDLAAAKRTADGR